MNHKISKDVHESYMTLGAMFDQLREASEAVSAYIFKHLPKGAEKQLKATVAEAVSARLTFRPGWSRPEPY